MSRRSSVWLLFAVFALATWPTAAVVADSRLGGSCSQDSDCDDNNLCTEDTCGPDTHCMNFPNYDVATTCCNPTTGSLKLIECDENHCYDDGICFPMGCDCCDLPDGDPCAEAAIPAASDWSVAVMALLLITAGTVLARTGLRRSAGTG